VVWNWSVEVLRCGGVEVWRLVTRGSGGCGGCVTRGEEAGEVRPRGGIGSLPERLGAETNGGRTRGFFAVVLFRLNSNPPVSPPLLFMFSADFEGSRLSVSRKMPALASNFPPIKEPARC
jgi:hypothetical protein